jgi:ATP-binding cassette subfamily B protein
MLKRFGVYFKDNKRDLIGGVICVALEGLFEMVIPLIMSQLIDVGVMNRDRGYILVRSLLMVGCALAALLLGALYARFAARAGQGFGAALREAEYKKVQSFSFSNMDQFRTPSLITRLTSDVTILQNAICNGIRPIVRGPFMMIVALALSISMSLKLAVVFFVALPVLGLGLYLILRQISPMYSKMQKAMDKVNSIVQENLIAIRTVKSFVRGDSECRKFSTVNESYKNASQRAYHFAALNMPCLQLVMYATITCLLWFGGNFIHLGTMRVGQLTGFLSYVMQILNSLMMISAVFLMLSRSMTSISRVFEVLDEKPAIADGESDAAVERGDIDFEHVSFKYQSSAKEYVLSDIDLHFKAGQTIGIIGGTGSAKTSLVQLIPRLYDVISGHVKIDGRDVKDYKLTGLRDAVGMVLQNNTLFSGSIRENLQWGNEGAADEEISWACHVACADEFLGRLPGGLDMDLGQGGVNVSGGQKQRLCIARALLKRPKILIFDDSTSAVDTATEAKIRRRLSEELRETTKIIITQRIGSIEEADQIVVLENGRLSQVGTHQELLASNPIYQDIYEYQRKGATA